MRQEKEGSFFSFFLCSRVCPHSVCVCVYTLSGLFMCEDAVQADRIMVSSETHQTQELLVPPQPDLEQEQLASPSSPSGAPLMGLDPEKMNQGPVNAITVLTLLDKLVNMLDAVQENQHKMEVQLL